MAKPDYSSSIVALKVCLMRPVYPEIGLNIRGNSGEIFFPNGVPDPKIQLNTSRLTNSTDNLFIVTEIDEGTGVLGL